MKITRTSVFSGITRTKDLNVTPEQVKAYQEGALIQDAFPNLTADEREFIITGAADEEWDEAFGEEE